MKGMVWALILLAGFAACKRSATSTEAVVPEVSIWALAPADALLVAVADGGSLELALRGLDAVRAGMGELPGIELPELLVSAEAREAAALDLQRPAGLIVSGAGFVAIAPTTDAAAFASALGKGWLCEPVRGHIACAEDATAIAGLDEGEGLASLDAAWPAELAGHIRIYSAEGAPMQLGVVLDRGLVELRASVPSVAEELPESAREAPTSLAHEVAKLAPAGFVRVRAPFAWLAEQAPAIPLPGGFDLRPLLASATGEVVGYALPGATTSGGALIGITDEQVAKAALAELCRALPKLVPGVDARAAAGSCRGSLPGDFVRELTQLGEAEPVSYSMSVRPEAIAVELNTPPDTLLDVPMSELARELLTGDWLVSTWGRGSILSGDAAHEWQDFAAVPGLESILWPLTRVQAVALAAGVRGDDLHLRLRVETIYANPPELAGRVDALLDELAAGEPEAMDALLALASEHPDTPFGQAVRSGAGGLMPPVALTGMIAAIAIPAFRNYQARARAAHGGPF